jgi:hypothetical protein
MELTGKCKDAFEECIQDNGFIYESFCQLGHDAGLYAPSLFYRLTPSMQYGVYVDFFDSVGITCGLFTYTIYNPIYYRGYAGNKTCESKQTRREARTAAITKANEIFNNKNK